MASTRMMRRMRELHERTRAYEQPPEEEEEQLEEEAPEAKPRNAFDLLAAEEDDGEVEEDDKDAERDDERCEREDAADTAGSSAASKKKRKKKKKGGKPAADEGENAAPAEEELDEIDRTLKELGLEPVGRAPSKCASDASSSGAQDAPLLGVDVKFLKADDELKRMFGAAVLKALSASEGAAHAQRIRSLGAGGSRGGRPQFRRSHLVKPKDHWPPTVGSTGLTMELVRTDAATGAAVFRYAHTAAYRAAHEAYEECVHSHDPNTIVQLLQHYPYHVEALLALSELMGYSGEPQQSADLLERALYSLELAWHPYFLGALSSGTARLDWDEEENKPLFSALFRHVCMIGRKGCVRSALECCKMLLSLDPRDPQGALYQLDFFALRSGQLEWLLRFLPQHREGSLMSMPSSVYSYALATLFLRQAIDGGERKDPAQLEEAKAALAGTTGVEGTMRHALLLHPAVLPKLMERLFAANAVAVDAEWRRILDHKLFKGSSCNDSASLEHLVDIFVERHHSLYRPATVNSHLKRSAAAAVAEAEGAAPAGPGSVRDWAAVREEVFPPSDSNSYSHLIVASFGDASARALPPDENPFLQQRAPPVRMMGGAAGGGGGEAPGDLRALQAMVRDLPPEERAQLQADLDMIQRGNLRPEDLANANPIIQFLMTLLPWNQLQGDNRLGAAAAAAGGGVAGGGAGGAGAGGREPTQEEMDELLARQLQEEEEAMAEAEEEAEGGMRRRRGGGRRGRRGGGGAGEQREGLVESGSDDDD